MVRLTDDLSRTVYATDNSVYQVRPHEVVVAESAGEIARFLTANYRLPSPRPVVARGGGTGTNGQSLTDGVMVDLKRGLNQILSVDPDEMVAVVQPGVVTGALNAELARHGLHWAPHTSTLNRATVGGMISTDAAGKGSLVYGRTHRHVLALEMLLDDGSTFAAEPVSVDEAIRRAEADGRAGEIWAGLLELDVFEGQDFGLPELARGFSGYGIDRLRRDGYIDPLALIVGAEGTLGVLTEATLRLTPLPRHTVLIVASYPDFRTALADALDLRVTAPTAIETFDEQTLEAGRGSPAWDAIGEVIGDHRGAVLLLEYTGDEQPDIRSVLSLIRDGGRCLGHGVIHDGQARAGVWKVRADAVGLLAKVEVGAPLKSARPTAFVEDCAVPVAAMPVFIEEFRQMLDGHGVQYGMFGHADVGCVHVRPALDLTDPDDETLLRTISEDVIALVARHGGVLWGEHGRGFRGEAAAAYLGSDALDVMRAVKTVFDPRDLFNPGKLYRPVGVDEPITALDEAPMRGQRDRLVPVDVRRTFPDAFACNGNGLCQQHDRSDVMCPSYQVSGDPALSPKGRSDLLREWLVRRAQPGDGGDLGPAIAENLHKCLSCAACAGRCPVEVDIPEMKSRFLEEYHRHARRPLSHIVLSRFEGLARWGARIPWLAGPMLDVGARLLGLVDLPKAQRARSSGRRCRVRTTQGVEVVLLADVFSSVLDPGTLGSAHRALESVGYSVAVAPVVASGKFDHVKGKRRRFARAARRQAELIGSIVDCGAVPVWVEPATGLMHDREYPTIHPGYPAGSVRSLAEVLADRIDAIDPGAGGSGRGTVTQLGHCTEQATHPPSLVAWSRVLEAAGWVVEMPKVGCCGMAGIFGHERANAEMSAQVWAMSWHALTTASRHGSIAATGYSCRSQALRMEGRTVLHPVHLL